MYIIILSFDCENNNKTLIQNIIIYFSGKIKICIKISLKTKLYVKKHLFF